MGAKERQRCDPISNQVDRPDGASPRAVRHGLSTVERTAPPGGRLPRGRVGDRGWSLVVQQDTRSTGVRRRRSERGQLVRSASSSTLERIAVGHSRRQVDGLFDPLGVVVAGAAGPSSRCSRARGRARRSCWPADASRSMLVTNFHVVRSLWTAACGACRCAPTGRSFNGSIVDGSPGRRPRDRRGATRAVAARDRTVDGSTSVNPSWSSAPRMASAAPSSTGIVSAVRGPVLQFSAPVSPGSSGGPVLDADGTVIGRGRREGRGRGAEGLSFAIPDRTCVPADAGLLRRRLS